MGNEGTQEHDDVKRKNKKEAAERRVTKLFNHMEGKIKSIYNKEDEFKFKVLKPWIILTEGDTLGAKQVYKRC